MVSLWEFLVDPISFWCTKIFFGRPNFFLVYQKFPETDQKFPETGQFFYWSTKKNDKKTEQLVDQETDQNHMDGTKVYTLKEYHREFSSEAPLDCCFVPTGLNYVLTVYPRIVSAETIIF